MDTQLFLTKVGHPIYTFTTKSLKINNMPQPFLYKIDVVFLADSLTEDFYNLIADKLDISVAHHSRITYQTNSSAATFIIDSAETLDDGTVNVTAHILIEDKSVEIGKLKDLFLRTTDSDYVNHETCILCLPCSLIRRLIDLGVDRKEIKQLIQQIQ